ncbi:MAG: sulfite exporter TauE/SafE family protein, partial [Rubrivivax sp.]
VESINAMRRVGAGGSGEVAGHGRNNWVNKLPLKMRFQRSKLYVSIIPVLGLGFAIGILGAVMGVGGGFIMVPAMIYLLRVPTSVVIGTSLFQIIFTAAISTVLQAATNTTVDVVLAFLLMVGGVVGAQFGAQAGRKLRGEQLRALLAILVLAVCARLGGELIVGPGDIYSISLPSGEVK